jgi:hypothetical protein
VPRPLAITLAAGLAASAAGAVEPPYFHLHLSKIRALEERVAREVVRIEVTRPAAGAPEQVLRFDGGGIHVGEGRILTCAFYLRDASEIHVVLPGGASAPARRVREDVSLGLALLRVPEARSLRVPEIAPEGGAKRGDAVYLLLNPATPNARLQLGLLIDDSRSGFYWRATFVARNGHPLYDEWGRVAGIGALPAKEGAVALFVPAWAVRKFLEGEVR